MIMLIEPLEELMEAQKHGLDIQVRYKLGAAGAGETSNRRLLGCRVIKQSLQSGI